MFDVIDKMAYGDAVPGDGLLQKRNRAVAGPRNAMTRGLGTVFDLKWFNG